MIHTLIDFLRSLTSPDGLRHLLSQVFSGWFGYAALCGIVFSETGLLAGFFLPGDSLLFTVGVVAGDGVLNIGLVIVLLSLSAMIGDSTGFFLAAGRDRPSSAVPIHCSSSANICSAPRLSTSVTGEGPSYTRASFPSCGHSPLLWPASQRCHISAFSHTASVADSVGSRFARLRDTFSASSRLYSKTSKRCSSASSSCRLCRRCWNSGRPALTRRNPRHCWPRARSLRSPRSPK